MKQLPKRFGKDLFGVMILRHELYSTMMTSNRQRDDQGKLVDNVLSATAIPDRLRHRAGRDRSCQEPESRNWILKL